MSFWAVEVYRVVDERCQQDPSFFSTLFLTPCQETHLYPEPVVGRAAGWNLTGFCREAHFPNLIKHKRQPRRKKKKKKKKKPDPRDRPDTQDK